MNMKKTRGGLGPLEAVALSTLSSIFVDEVFTMPEARRVLRMDGPRLRKLLFDLADSRWIERIEKGKYVLVPLDAGPSARYGTHPFIFARKMVAPYYIGFASALNYHGITEQVGKTVYVATTRQRKPIDFHATRYCFVNLGKPRFFGFKEDWIGKVKFNISDVEKTVVDCLYLPEYGLGLPETVKAFKAKPDIGRMCDYALRMKNGSLVKRLGFLLDTLGVDEQMAKELSAEVSGGYCLLDATGPKNGKPNKKWRIIENIRVEDLKVES